MSINPISPTTSPSAIPPVEGDSLLDNSKTVDQITYEERHKKLIETNTRYIFDQMTRSTQRFTQEMIRQAREQQKEDGE